MVLEACVVPFVQAGDNEPMRVLPFVPVARTSVAPPLLVEICACADEGARSGGDAVVTVDVEDPVGFRPCNMKDPRPFAELGVQVIDWT